MKTLELKANLRKVTGKTNAKELRKENKVPAELYGESGNMHIYLDSLELKKAIYTPHVYKISLDIEGKKVDSVIREVQFHPVTDKLVHIDFEEINNTKDVTVGIPLKFVGTSAAVLSGAKLKTNARKLTVKGKLQFIPEILEVDITQMGIGDKIRVKDLKYEGLSILDAPNNVLVAVLTSRGVVADASTEAEKAK